MIRWHFVVAIAVASPLVAVGDPPQPSEVATKAVKDAQRRLDAGNAAPAIKSLRALREHPTGEATKLLLERGLRDRHAEVRHASLETLLQLGDGKDVVSQLVAQVYRVSKEPRRERYIAFGLLLRVESPEAEREASAWLDKSLRSSLDVSGFLTAMVAEWALCGVDEPLPLLTRFLQLPVAKESFAARRGAAQTLMTVQQPEAVTELIKLLANEPGELRLDIARYLTAVSDQQIGLDAEAWQRWWQDARGQFRWPRVYTLPSVEQMANEQASRYYNLPIYARRVLFVLDTSSSMKGLRLATAKQELRKAILGLTADQHFGLLIFNSNVQAWQKQLVPATAESRQAAVQFVDKQEVAGKTATFDALDEALWFDAEAVYFLTDGRPTMGRIVEPSEIVLTITRRNRARLMSIYTIGVGAEVFGKSGLFLARLAELNFGAFRHVN